MPVAIERRTHINAQLFAQMYWNQMVQEVVLAIVGTGGRVQTSEQLVLRGTRVMTVRMIRVVFSAQVREGLDFSIGR